LPLATSMMRSRSSTPTYPCATGDRTLEQPQWRELQGSNSRPTPLWVSLARQPAIVHEQTRASARPERSGCGPPTAGRHQPDRPPLRASGALGDACAQGRFAAPRTKSPRRVSRPRARGPRFFLDLGRFRRWRLRPDAAPAARPRPNARGGHPPRRPSADACPDMGMDALDPASAAPSDCMRRPRRWEAPDGGAQSRATDIMCEAAAACTARRNRPRPIERFAAAPPF